MANQGIEPSAHGVIGNRRGRQAPGRRRVKGRLLWLKLHLYTALALGPFFFVLGLTGSINVFRWEIDALLNPQLRLASAAGQYRPWREILSAAQQAHPGMDGRWSLQVAEEPAAMVLVRCRETSSDDGFALRMIWVNPYTAEPVSSRAFGEFFSTWIYDLHWALLLGETGHLFVGCLGVALMVSLVSGIYLWWPKNGGWRKALTIKRRAGSQRLIFDWHKAIGLYIFPVLLLLAFTGAYLVFPDVIKPLVKLFSPVGHEVTWKSERETGVMPGLPH